MRSTPTVVDATLWTLDLGGGEPHAPVVIQPRASVSFDVVDPAQSRLVFVMNQGSITDGICVTDLPF